MLNRCVSLACGLALMAAGAGADEPPAAAIGYTMTPERLAASVAAVMGLLGVIVGGLALARSRTGNGLRGGIVAVTTGLISVVLGGLVVATANGGLGTGNGLGGGVVALVLGLIGVVLGGWARVRARRTG